MKRSLLCILLVSLLVIACAKTTTSPAPQTTPAATTPTQAPKTTQAATPTPTPTPAPTAKKYEFKYSIYHPPDHPQTTDLAQYFINLVQNKTQGQITIKLYPSGQLADMKSQVSALSQGVVQFASAGAGLDARLKITSIGESGYPEAASDYFIVSKAAWAAVPLMEPVFTGLKIKPLGPYVSGRYDMWTRKEVKSLEDLKGLKIRGPGGGINQLIDALGAVAVSISTAEMYTALERGTIDGSLGIMTSMISGKVYEVAKYAFMCDVTRTAYYTSMNLDAFNSLPKQLQNTLMESAWATMEHFEQKMTDDDGKMIKLLEGKGAKFFWPSDTEVKRWKAALGTVVQSYIKDNGDLGRQIYETMAKKSLELQAAKK